MKILAVDTSTRFLCLGLLDGAKLYEYNLEAGRRISACLIPVIKRVLDSVNLKIEDIDYLASGVGPGSFTGVRITMATLKGLGLPFNKPIVGICSLDILALNAVQDNAVIIPVIDAKRDLIYTAFYKRKNNIMKRISPYMLVNREELIKHVNKITGNFRHFAGIILGDALALHKDAVLSRTKNIILLDKDYWNFKPCNLIALASQEIKKKKEKSLFKLNPIYLYPKECQIRHKKD